jgi:hypothetical protein
MENYRNHFSEPVKCIVGLRDLASDVGVSLEELAAVASDCIHEVLDRQQKRIVQIFVDLVSSVPSASSSVDYVDPGEWIHEEPFVLALTSETDSLLFGKPPVPSGKLQFSTITQRGWTLRVYARNTAYGSISILWKQAIPGQVLRVPSYEQLKKHLRLDAVDSYRSFFRETVELDIAQIAGLQSLPTAESQLIDVIRDYATVAGLLATAA